MESERKSPLAPHTSTPAEIKDRNDAERSGLPHVIYRDVVGAQKVVWLRDPVVTVGRQNGVGICLSWDDEVSRAHAELRRIEDVWILVDEGSRNGSYVDGSRVTGRRRLDDRAVLMFGSTTVVLRAPGSGAAATKAAKEVAVRASLSSDDRKLLVALCRPLRDETHAVPATNRQIADELFISVPAVKRRLSVLFKRFDLAGLAQNEKRTRLADEAMRTGLATSLDG